MAVTILAMNSLEMLGGLNPRDYWDVIAAFINEISGGGDYTDEDVSQ